MRVRRCPECGSEVHLSDRASELLGKMELGCNNTEDHDSGGAIVMWPEGDND